MHGDGETLNLLVQSKKALRHLSKYFLLRRRAGMRIFCMTFQRSKYNSPSPSSAKGEQMTSLNFPKNLSNREWASGGSEHIDGGFFYGHEFKVEFFLASPRVKPT